MIVATPPVGGLTVFEVGLPPLLAADSTVNLSTFALLAEDSLNVVLAGFKSFVLAAVVNYAVILACCSALLKSTAWLGNYLIKSDSFGTIAALVLR